jgi:hypothetical protein
MTGFFSFAHLPDDDSSERSEQEQQKQIGPAHCAPGTEKAPAFRPGLQCYKRDLKCPRREH